MTKTQQDFTIWAGDSRTLQFGITASDGSSQDQTGNTASWVLQDEENSSCYLAQISGTISGSTVSVILAPSHTSSLCGYYYHELALTASGSAVTAAVGTALINRSNI